MACTNVDQILRLCDEFTPSNPPQYFFDHNPETFAGFYIQIYIIIFKMEIQFYQGYLRCTGVASSIFLTAPEPVPR